MASTKKRKKSTAARRKRLFPAGMIALIALGGAAGIWLYVEKSGPKMDRVIKKTLSNIDTIHAYTQQVETETTFSDRRLYIIGTYHINTPQKHFYSFSTTTLTTLPEGSSHSFTLHNIAMGDDIYTKIETDSDSLKHSIPHGPLWHHFKRDAIPQRFTDIAVPGPILNNLRLFSKEGKYLSLIEKIGNEQWDDEEMVRYTFALSAHAFNDSEVGQGALSAIIDHIGRDGTVDVWVLAEQYEIRHIVLSNPPYYSTTTIVNHNTVPEIVPPPVEEIEG